MARNIIDLSIPALEAWCQESCLKKFAVSQILAWLYQKRVTSFAEMTNISKEARHLLETHFEIGRLSIARRHPSKIDGSTKFLLRLKEGRGVEAVLMPQKNRLTLCISSQVGCAMGCRFCKTAEMKLVRNLTPGEILGQVLEIQRESKTRISNVVLMGMGEPLHNYESVICAVNLMTDPRAMGLSARKVTVSTVGLAPEIERFGRDTKVKLALSLNATTEEGREKLMPVTRRYSLEEVLRACKNYTQGSKHKVTFEYVVMAGVNDQPEDQKRLAKIASHLPSKINLIPYNEYEDSPFKSPSEEALMAFHKYLADRHFQVNIRRSRGSDIMAACGQLCQKERLLLDQAMAPGGFTAKPVPVRSIQSSKGLST